MKLGLIFACLFSVLVTVFAGKKSKKGSGFRVCAVKSCGKNQTSELDSWECFARRIFEPTDDPGNEIFVEHDCLGVGWGNSIRGLHNSMAIAAVLNRRLIIRFKAMSQLWLPPFDLKSWDFGLDAALAQQGKSLYESKETWDFEAYGRSPNRWATWVKSLKTSRERVTQYHRPLLTAGVCGGEREVVSTGKCITKALPLFGRCVVGDSGREYLPDHLLLVPFFYSVFAKPSPLLIKKLKIVRDRVSLPNPPPGFEPTEGLWGLQTPGYYIMALHFRRVPLGFEPLSVELNDDRSREWRLEMLAAFWAEAKELARQAKKIAKCRGEKLLIYFATDNARDLRPEATKYLSSYGKVIFGLTLDEVGHVSPQWNMRAHEEIVEKALQLRKEGKIGVGSSSILRNASRELPAPAAATAEVDAAGSLSLVSTQADSDKQLQTVGKSEDDVTGLIVDVLKSESAVQEHGIMALVEWWILANAQWLVTHGGTSFSDSASGWGMGPRGRMERMDVIHGKEQTITVFRRDWTGDGCSVVGAADPEQARKCPNRRSY